MNHLDLNLCKSSHSGDIASVKRLLEAGANVHAFHLTLSSQMGHIAVVKLLLEAGADVHARDSEPLYASSKRGHVEVVKLLLARGAGGTIQETTHKLWAKIKPKVRSLLLATFRLRRWVRCRLMRLRLHRIASMHQLSVELQYAPPRGPFRGGIKYAESLCSFQHNNAALTSCQKL